MYTHGTTNRSILSFLLTCICLLFFENVFALQDSIPIPLAGEDIGYTVENGVVTFSENNFFGYYGQPALPSYGIKFILPDKTDLESVQVTLSNIVEESFTGQISPKVEDLGGPTPSPTAVIVDGYDTTVYNQNALFPSDNIIHINKGKGRETNIINIMISPYRYNPVTSEVRKITNATD